MNRLLVVGLLGLTAACGGNGDTTVEGGSPAETTAASVATTTAPVATKASGPSECTDPARDVPGAQPGSDITKVTLRSDGTTLSVTYDLSGMPTAPADGASWILKVQVDGGGIYQLGLKLVGREASRFVFDFGPARQENLTPTYTAEDRRLVVAFPLASFRAVGKSFSWSATTTYAGKDIDDCPENGTVRFVA